jgi:GH24 family phage-related lysozyme (muramidase)
VTTNQRIAAIQSRLGLEADGVIGPATLTAIENLLDRQLGPAAEQPRLTCSLVGLNALVQFEISSDAYYNRFLKHPAWPGGASGVTIGIGYDLGYCSEAQLRRDWRGHVGDAELAALETTCRLKGSAAGASVSRQSIRAVTVELAHARQVFYQSSLPAYAAKCMAAYPGIDKLPPDAQTAILSLVYNRGTAKSGSTRSEMQAIGPLIEDGELQGIAGQIIGMKRLWEGKGLDGLLTRRDQEAALVLSAQRSYGPDELVKI